jgi:hypothetical protein
MTVINVPMYFYSKSLGQAQLPDTQTAQEAKRPALALRMQATRMQTRTGEPPQNMPPLICRAKPLFNEQCYKTWPMKKHPKDSNPWLNSTSHRFMANAKNCSNDLNVNTFADKPYKAFVYSFDGESAYCADAYTDKSQEAAEEIVMRECESHHAGSGKYSPCRIYASE